MGATIEACDGRWCYRQEHVITSTRKDGSVDEIKTYQYYDMETGIMIRQVGAAEALQKMRNSRGGSAEERQQAMQELLKAMGK